MDHVTDRTKESVSLGSVSVTPVDFSVVVPIHNRRDQLEQLLEALSQQEYPRERFEVLVCDDGSDEDFRDLITAAACQGLHIRYFRQARRGPGAARNLGLAHAAGETVVFTDSDCLPCQKWLSAVRETLLESSIGLVGGRINYREADHLSGRCLNFLMSSSLGAAGARDPRGLVSMKYYPRTCNLAVRRHLALAANGFPESRHGEDLEFSHRVKRLGTEVRFVPEAVVVHNERRTWSQIFREAFSKGRARVHLARCCGLHETIHALPAGLVVYGLALAIAVPLWPAAASIIALPGVAYVALLFALTLQAAWCLRETGAILLVPVYAATLHLGYGLGYLMARLRPATIPRNPSPVDWQTLRLAGGIGRPDLARATRT